MGKKSVLIETHYTMLVLNINTKFGTAEPRHFEMEKYPPKEIILKKGLFHTGFEPRTTKTSILRSTDLPLDQADKT